MFKSEYKVEDFQDLANYILNNVVLNACGTLFRLCEIEFYYWTETHKDNYVHRITDQKSHSKFYFHKYHNGTFKSGTYKGLDICLGNANTYFGVLIRSIQNLETGEFTEGSCNCVNKMLKCFPNNVTTVSELFEKHFTNLSQIDISNEKFGLKTHKLDKQKIYCGPRIGLSDKYPEFKNVSYRYATNINSIKKQRKTFVECVKINLSQNTK